VNGEGKEIFSEIYGDPTNCRVPSIGGACVIITSKNLETLANQKCNEGCREKVKKAASVYFQEDETDAFMRGMLYGIKLMSFNESVVTPIRKGILVFNNKTEQEVFELLSNITKQSTPRSVLVKMAATRIARLLELVDSFKRDEQGRFQMPEEREFWHNFSVESVETVDQFQKLYTSLEKNVPRYKFKNYSPEDYKEFLNRPELDDSIISDAWSLVKVKQVIEA
jgi:hypothetical protein